MTVAELFVQCLKNEGIRYIFGVPGEENQDLLLALADAEDIEFIPCRHEQGAAFIANVWGRLTGKAGVCLGTLGPGATNLLTGVADANLDKAPLIAITGQGGLTRLHHESHQNIDVVQMFGPITKWNTAVKAPQVVPEVIRKAFKVAETEKPGATHIELSEDVAKLEVSASLKPLDCGIVGRTAPDPESISASFRLIEQAKKPMIIAGNGAIRNGASEELTQLVKDTKLPIVSTFMGKGAVSDRMPQSLFSIGLGLKDYVMEAVERADLVLTVGYDIAEYSPDEWNPNRDKTIIHIDFEPAEVYDSYIPKVEIVGDIAKTISQLNKKICDGGLFDNSKEWYKPIRQRIEEDIHNYSLTEGDSFTVPGVINLVREILPDDGLVISDVGAHKMWIARNFPTYSANGCIISNGLASMGIALPGGIAASMIDPNRPVVAMMGDGGALMNIQELETAYRLGVHSTFIVFNDNDYGLIKWKQEMSKGRNAYTELGNPDFKKLAESFGIEGHKPTSVSELKSILEETIPSKKLTLIEIPVDAGVNEELVEKLESYWA